jgi:hypothetical protein
MTTSNTVICVLGMHRSGTSCLTGCLEERGIVLGEVVNSAPHNLKGNKESVSLRSINNDVLQMSNGAWDVPPETLVWDDHLRARRDAHIAAFAAHPVWGFKDPRTLLTLPFWLEAGCDMRFIGTFRHPSSVVRSLMARKGKKMIPKTPALELWKHHNRKILELHDRVSFPIVSFDSSPEIYDQSVTQIATSIGLPKLPGRSSFYASEMRTGLEGLENDWPVDDESRDIYAMLQARAIEPTQPDVL